ncbi:hypothetical protein I3843_09G064100 [Carya illinoinensis]|nr:hypothetical protein I3760_09G063500 [Carya illinoinensis]KAG7962381.1 hypothetical protein I3843_09G064100 [Carya illinoinensis]KAG7962382.1 hypothetical protein I3843_09G064100 [Carya illinoinensis]
MLAAIADSSLCRPSINVQLRFFLPIVSLFATHCNSHRLISVMTRPAEGFGTWTELNDINVRLMTRVYG